MKYLFYLLLVVNVVFFLWKAGLQPEDVVSSDETEQEWAMPADGKQNTPPAQDAAMWEEGGVTQQAVAPAVDSSQSAGTLQTPENAPNVDSSAPVSVALSENGCYELGPVQAKEAAEGFLQLMKSNAKDTSVATRSGSVPGGWWVLYPRAATPEAALANRRMLEGKGVVDTWLFDKGPLQGAISMGLYKTREEADQAAQQLRDQGIGVQVAPRLVRGDVYSVRFSWERLPLDLEEVVRVLNSQDPALQMPMPVPCKL